MLSIGKVLMEIIRKCLDLQHIWLNLCKISLLVVLVHRLKIWNKHSEQVIYQQVVYTIVLWLILFLHNSRKKSSLSTALLRTLLMMQMGLKSVVSKVQSPMMIQILTRILERTSGPVKKMSNSQHRNL